MARGPPWRVGGGGLLSDAAQVFELPSGWELVSLTGGRHHGARFWAHRPGKRFRVTPYGDVYEQVRQGEYAADGTAPRAAAPVIEQMELM